MFDIKVRVLPFMGHLVEDEGKRIRFGCIGCDPATREMTTWCNYSSSINSVVSMMRPEGFHNWLVDRHDDWYHISWVEILEDPSYEKMFLVKVVGGQFVPTLPFPPEMGLLINKVIQVKLDPKSLSGDVYVDKDGWYWHKSWLEFFAQDGDNGLRRVKP